VIDPVMENTGQGIKNIEALMFGKPVVSTWATLVITHRPAILRRADRISILF
jgi:ABC-type multidrug transport system fused ATPase/permease subunit